MATHEDTLLGQRHLEYADSFFLGAAVKVGASLEQMVIGDVIRYLHDFVVLFYCFREFRVMICVCSQLQFILCPPEMF